MEQNLIGLGINTIDPSVFGTREKQTWTRQEAFLKCYAEVGSIRSAARATAIHRDSVRLWKRDDVFRFADRFEAAEQTFREYLQQMAFDRIQEPQGNRGSDVLLIFLLKGHWREKYGDATLPTQDAAKEFLSELRGMARKEPEQRHESEDGIHA